MTLSNRVHSGTFKISSPLDVTIHKNYILYKIKKIDVGINILCVHVHAWAYTVPMELDYSVFIVVNRVLMHACSLGSISTSIQLAVVYACGLGSSLAEPT